MKDYKVEKRRKDKSDFATVDKVLDKNTMSIINKLEKREKIFDLSGAISSGKEANIYTARCSTSLISKFIQPNVEDTEKVVPVVLKIYKTSTMLFNDRDRYIVDEKRFTNFCTSNSRKLIKVWAEKEVRNLKRMSKYGILCPAPLYLKKSILIMTMIGENEPAPRLKDAKIDDWNEAYKKCIDILTRLYQKAGLIHADFSEYNLVYFNNEIYVIDVGQSIEKDQENSNNFLAMDVRNCNLFFARKGVKVRSEIEIFEEITGLKVPKYLVKGDGKLSRETFIPSRITEVVNKEDFELFMADNSGRLKAATGGNENSSENSTEILSDNENEISSDSIGKNLNNSLDENDNSDKNSNMSKKTVNGEVIINSDKIINIFSRKLRLKDVNATIEEEKAYNKERKQIVKEMNKERRAMRAVKNERMETQKSKKSVKKGKNNK